MTQRPLFVPSRRLRPCRPGCPDCHRSQKSRPPKPETAAWMAERWKRDIAGVPS